MKRALTLVLAALCMTMFLGGFAVAAEGADLIVSIDINTIVHGDGQ